MRLTFRKVGIAQCLELGHRRGNPPYLRLHHLALAKAGANGHAPFKRGELAIELGKAGKRYRNIEDAIAKAIGYGLLDPTSMPTCLVLPHGLVAPPKRLPELDCLIHGGTHPFVTMATCHPDRKHYALKMCEPCYRADRRSRDAVKKV